MLQIEKPDCYLFFPRLFRVITSVLFAAPLLVEGLELYSNSVAYALLTVAAALGMLAERRRVLRM